MQSAKLVIEFTNDFCLGPVRAKDERCYFEVVAKTSVDPMSRW